jgi:hypothetical protein
MNMLAAMFDNTDWLIVHSPFIYTAGVTKSVTLCDVSLQYTARCGDLSAWLGRS